jgi:hypothetical protein
MDDWMNDPVSLHPRDPYKYIRGERRTVFDPGDVPGCFREDSVLGLKRKRSSESC